LLELDHANSTQELVIAFSPGIALSTTVPLVPQMWAKWSFSGTIRICFRRTASCRAMTIGKFGNAWMGTLTIQSVGVVCCAILPKLVAFGSCQVDMLASRYDLHQLTPTMTGTLLPAFFLNVEGAQLQPNKINWTITLGSLLAKVLWFVARALFGRADVLTSL
jgi:hypothetical protein